MNNINYLALFLGLLTMALAKAASSEEATKVPSLEVLPFELTIEQRNGQVTILSSQIEIEANKGSDLFTNPTGSKNSANVPSVQFFPDGDFIFSAKVSATFGDSPYDGGALVVYSDDTTWGKLLFERFKSGKLGVATTVSNPTGDDAYHSTFDNSELYLKIVRHDTSYVFYTSADGSSWNFARHFDLGVEKNPGIGFIAQSPLAGSFTATFSDISFRSQRIKDFWQGE